MLPITRHSDAHIIIICLMMDYADPSPDRQATCEYFAYMMTTVNERLTGLKNARQIIERLVKRGYATTLRNLPKRLPPRLRVEKVQVYKITQRGIAASLRLHNQALFDKCS